MRKIANGTISIWQLSHTNCMFQIRKEVGAELKLSFPGPLILDIKQKELEVEPECEPECN